MCADQEKSVDVVRENPWTITSISKEIKCTRRRCFQRRVFGVISVKKRTCMGGGASWEVSSVAPPSIQLKRPSSANDAQEKIFGAFIS